MGDREGVFGFKGLPQKGLSSVPDLILDIWGEEVKMSGRGRSEGAEAGVGGSGLNALFMFPGCNASMALMGLPDPLAWRRGSIFLPVISVPELRPFEASWLRAEILSFHRKRGPFCARQERGPLCPRFLAPSSFNLLGQEALVRQGAVSPAPTLTRACNVSDVWGS